MATRRDSAPPPRQITDDHQCANCGYNVRGLNWGRNCPECGTRIARPHAIIERPDTLLGADPAERSRLSVAFGIMALVLVIAVIARWMTLFIGIVSPVGAWYYLLCIALSAGWGLAAMFIMTSDLGRRITPIAALRWVVLVTQLFWLIAFTIRLLSLGNATGYWVFQACRAVAGLGWIIMMAGLHRAAVDADLDTAAPRLLNATWFIPIFAVIAAIFPRQIPWIIIVPLGMILVIWSWTMIIGALALRELQQHAGWANRIMHEAPGREERIAAKRAELEREARGRIRQV